MKTCTGCSTAYMDVEGSFYKDKPALLLEAANYLNIWKKSP